MQQTKEATLVRQYADLRGKEADIRFRDAALRLGVSEAELLDATGGSSTKRIDPTAAALLEALTSVGRCMALTRNESAVIETKGTYAGVEVGPHVGQVVGQGIDLRVFPTSWSTAFAVNEPDPRRDGERRRSLQVFDASGTAVHKVYLQSGGDVAAWAGGDVAAWAGGDVAAWAGGDVAAWDRMVETLCLADPAQLVVKPAAEPTPERPDAEVDARALTTEWDAMKDTHEFFHILRKHRVGRQQALRLAGEERAYRVANDSISRVLHAEAESSGSFMVFIGNKGCLEIFTGSVQRVVRSGPWINVLDSDFNLHLREDLVTESWIVNKPTSTGRVTSLELYDANGETIAMLFADRHIETGAAAWDRVVETLVRA